MLRINFKFLFYLFAAISFSFARADDAVDFFRAVNVDDTRTVSRLLAAGFDPNTRGERGQLGLTLALRDASPKVARLLIEHPAIRLDAANADGETPLMMAALRGNLEWTQQLLERGAPVNREGWSPLHYAATGPEPRIVALLLERGAQVESKSPNRTTPLMMAARYGAEESVSLLLARGASTQWRNDRGLNAADFARLAGRETLATRLEKATP
jgi:uncharacterized protein